MNNQKAAQMEEALLEASENGKYPIVVDTSPCLAEIKGSLQNPALRFSLYEPAEFIANHLLDKLEFNKVKKHVAIHVPCSSKKLGVEETFTKLAEKCAEEVTGSGIPCCGMAGDRGMRYPELTGGSLKYLAISALKSSPYSSKASTNSSSVRICPFSRSVNPGSVTI